MKSEEKVSNANTTQELADMFLDAQFDTFFVFDPETGKAVRWNKKFRQACGYTDQEIADMKAPESYYSKEDLINAVKATEKLIKEGEASVGMSLITKSGKKIPYEYNASVIGVDGRSLVVSVGRDLTARKKAEFELKERVKELDCLYSISKIVEKQGIGFDEILQGIVDSIPAGWQYSEITCARVIFEGKEYVSARFQETKWKQVQEIKPAKNRAGVLEVYYLEEKPDINEGPFLKEERNLIDAIAEIIAGKSERRKAEKQIENLAKFPSENPNPIARVSHDGILMYANDSFIEEIVKDGPKVGDKIPEQWVKMIEEVYNSGNKSETEVKMNNKIYSFEQVPIHKSGYINIYGKDVTEQKKAEEELRNNQQFNELLIDTLPYPSMVITKSKSIVTANRMAQDLGARVGGFCWDGFGHLEFIPKEDKAYFEKNKTSPCDGTHCSFCLADRAFKNNELTNDPEVKAFGKIWDTYWIPLGDDVHYLHFAIDITKQKLSEEELKKHQNYLQELVDDRTLELRKTNEELVSKINDYNRSEAEKREVQTHLIQAQKLESIGELTGGVAHDFNNLLTIILMGTMEVMEEVGKESDMYNSLMQVKLSAKRAASLTRQLLLFSRRQPMKRELLAINEHINELLEMLKRLVGENLFIETNLDPDLYLITADKGSLDQVVMNLVVNAKDAMLEGGEITIETENVTFDKNQTKHIYDAYPGKFVCVSVCDQGTGIDEETVKRIFEPFFTTKEKDKGTGLGLSVVHGIVKQHNGWININTEKGQGTTFKIYFPASDLKSVPEGEVLFEEDLYRGNNERILLVEDEDPARKIVKRILNESGFVVFDAKDSEEAQRISDENQGNFHIIFSDIGLPGKGGIELVKEITEKNPKIKVY